MLAVIVVIEGRSGLLAYAFTYGGLVFSFHGTSVVAHTSDHLEQGQVLEATRGLLLVYGLGALCGPLLAGIAMELSGPGGSPSVSASLAAVLAFFGFYRMARRAPPPIGDQTDFVPMMRTSPIALEMLPEADPSPELELPMHGPEN